VRNRAESSSLKGSQPSQWERNTGAKAWKVEAGEEPYVRRQRGMSTASPQEGRCRPVKGHDCRARFARYGERAFSTPAMPRESGATQLMRYCRPRFARHVYEGYRRLPSVCPEIARSDAFDRVIATAHTDRLVLPLVLHHYLSNKRIVCFSSFEVGKRRLILSFVARPPSLPEVRGGPPPSFVGIYHAAMRARKRRCSRICADEKICLLIG